MSAFKNLLKAVFSSSRSTHHGPHASPDYLYLGDGNHSVDAGEGNNTVFAGRGNDTIIAGAGHDHISAGGGNNAIDVGQGNNWVSAGSGNDTVIAGAGHDVISVGDGNNAVDAGHGNNLITSGRGNDTIVAGNGHDSLSVGDGNNSVDAGGGNNTIFSGNGHDSVTAGSGNDIISVGDGNNFVAAGDGNNLIISGRGNDTITAGAGSDIISAGDGDNVIDSGAGSDLVIAGSGRDIFIHRLTADRCSRDNFFGGSGQDTLRLELTSADWARSDVQSDIAAFLRHLAQPINQFLNPYGLATQFNFSATNLSVVAIENLEISVNGVLLDPRDQAVKAVLDSLNIGEDTASVSVDLLANDLVPDRAVSVQLLSNSSLGTLTLLPLLNGALQTATLTFTPNAGMQSLAFGQTASETLTYRVTDVDGDTSTASITITVIGQNDAATIAGLSTGNLIEDGQSSVSGVLTVTDVDTGEAAFQIPTSHPSAYGSFTFDAVTGAWSYAVNSAAVQALAMGQQVQDSLTATSLDGTASKVIDVTITGTNDAPTVTALTSAVTEDAPAASLNMLAGAADADAGTVLSVANVTGLTAGVTLLGSTLTVDPAHAAFQSLALGQEQTVTISYDVTDEVGGSAAQTAVITITGTNDAPTANADSAVLDLAAAAAVNLAVLSNDTDLDDGDVLTVTSLAAQSANGAALTLNPDGTVHYAAGSVFNSLAAGTTATDTFTYTATDSAGAISTATATITVLGAGQNTAPAYVGGDSLTGFTIGNLVNSAANTVNLATLFADSEGNALTYAITGLPLGFSLDQNTGILTLAAPFTNAVNYIGTRPITVTASDGLGGVATASLDLVIAVNNNFGPIGLGTATRGSDAVDTLIFGGSVPNASFSIHAGGAADTISFSAGAASSNGRIEAFGDAGDDTITFAQSAAATTGRIFAYGGDGSDSVTFGARAAESRGTIETYGGAGNDTMTFGNEAGNNFGRVDVYGGDGGDNVTFGTNAGLQSGAINLYGGLGADTFRFGNNANNVTLDLGADSDVDRLTFDGLVKNARVLNWRPGDVLALGGTWYGNVIGSDTAFYRADGSTVTVVGVGALAPSSVVSGAVLNTAPALLGDGTITTAVGNLASNNFSLNLSTLFADADGHPLSFTVTGLPAGFSYSSTTGSISNTASLAYSPDLAGSYTVTVMAKDGFGGTLSTNMTFVVALKESIYLNGSYVATAGADMIVVDGTDSANNSSLNLGAGNDTLSFGDFGAAYTANDIDGGDGDDVISFGDYAGASGTLTVNGGNGDDRITFGREAGAFGTLVVDGGIGSDTIIFADGEFVGNSPAVVTIDLGLDSAADTLIFGKDIAADTFLFDATVLNWTAGVDNRVDVSDTIDWYAAIDGGDTVFYASSVGSIRFVGVSDLGTDVDTFLF